MRPYVFKIAAGAEEPEFFGEGVNYIRLNSTSTVNVTVKDPDGNQEYTLAPGDDVLFRPFNELRVSHDGAADTGFTLYVGRNTKAGSAAVSGNIQPVGGSANLASKPIFIPDPVTMVDSDAGACAAGVVTIVTPAANTAGVRVDALGLVHGGTGLSAAILSNTAAPTGVNDGRVLARMTLTSSANPSSIYNSHQQSVMPVIIPAGEGLYVYSSAASGNYHVSYEIL